MSWSDAEVVHVMSELGCSDMQQTGTAIKSRCPCPKSKKDRCFVVMTGNRPGYHCHRCKEKGILSDMVWDEWFRGRRMRTSMLVVSAHEQEYLCGERPEVKLTRLEYVPLSSKPVIKDRERPEPAPIRRAISTQLTLSGEVEKVQETPSMEESDLDRFVKATSRYLLNRGIDEKTQEAYDIRGNPKQRRVVFPIRDWDGKLVGTSARRVYNGPKCYRCKAEIGCGKDMKHKCPQCGALHAKYLHSKGFRKSSVLYGEWLYEEGCVPVLVEGMTDVSNLYQKGLRPPHALPLAVMGGNAATSQIERLLQRFPTGPVCVLRDHDDPSKYPDLPDGKAPGDIMADGVEATIKSIDPDREVVHFIPPMGSDPGDLTEEQVFEVSESIALERTGTVVIY